MNNQALIYFFSSIFIGFLFAYLGMITGKILGRKVGNKSMISTLVTAGFGAIWEQFSDTGITNYGKNIGLATFICHFINKSYWSIFVRTSFSRNLSPFIYAWLELGYWEVIRPFYIKC